MNWERERKPGRTIATIIVILFALIGFIFVAGFVGIKLHIFKDPGAVDYNDRFFQKTNDETTILPDTTENNVFRVAHFYSVLRALNEFYPMNAMLIHKAYLQHKNIALAERMIKAASLNLMDNSSYNSRIAEYETLFGVKDSSQKKDCNLFAWMNIPEWKDFRIAVLKDSALIDSAGKVSGVEPRLIVSILLGEQMRLFNSSRETFKKVLSPLKILSVESNFSLGVTGIKETTANLAENYLKDSASIYYPGKKYEHLLDFNSADIRKERYDRLVNYRNHYYSYLYAAVILKEMMHQWKKSGFDISSRPEILATLFNIGFALSKPKSNPSVGGSTVKINQKDYTFGALAYEFYYSGEMEDFFPYKPDYCKNDIY